VLTAGHCVDPAVVMLPSQDAVTASTTVNFNTVDIVGDSGTVVSASATFKDPLFDSRPDHLGKNDLGLIQLATPVTDVIPSSINLNAALAPVGTVATIVGYGLASQPSGAGTTGIEFDLTNRISIRCFSMDIGSDTNLLCFSQTDNKAPAPATRAGRVGDHQRQVDRGRRDVVRRPAVRQLRRRHADRHRAAVPGPARPRADRLPVRQAGSDCPAHRVCFAHSCIAQPFGPNGLGSVCNTAADCDSSICAVSSQDGKRCSLTCSPSDPSTCPDGFESFKSSTSVGACWPVPGGGCCYAGGPGSPATALLGLGAVALGLRRRRRLS
jgi:hypothetical protein